MFLRSFEVKRVSQTGVIELKAGAGPNGTNRYSSAKSEWAIGQDVVVYFDPADLRADVHVYSLEGRYLFDAQRLATYAFNDTSAAREHAKYKAREIKATKKAAEAIAMKNAIAHRTLFQESVPIQVPESKPPASAPVRMTRGTVRPQQDGKRAETAPQEPPKARASFLDAPELQALMEKSIRDKSPLWIPPSERSPKLGPKP